jgi:hypothetical protein
MIPDVDLIELKEILTSEYQVELTLEEVRKIADSLINIYSAILDDRQQVGSHEE